MTSGPTKGAMAQAWKRLRRIELLAEGPSVFAQDDANRAFFVDGRQVVNLFDDESLEVRLTRKLISAHRPRLKSDPRVELRRSGSDWITVHVRSPQDIALVVELAEMAAEVHRPSPGVTVRPPPAGADLARRRRFH